MARKRMRQRAERRADQPAEPAAEQAPRRAARQPQPQIAAIRALEDEIQSQGSAKGNNLVDLLGSMRDEDDAVAKAALHALRRLFTGGCACLQAAASAAPSAQSAGGAPPSQAAAEKAASIYTTWVRGRYCDFKEALLSNLGRSAKELQIVSTVALMQLVKLESTLLGADAFAVDTFATVVRAVLLTRYNRDDVVKMFVRSFVSEYDDVRYHSLKVVKAVLSGVRQRTPDAAALETVHSALVLLLGLRMPPASQDKLESFWVPKNSGADTAAAVEPGSRKKRKTGAGARGKRVTQARSHRKAFGDCWTELLQVRGLDVAAYRRVLLGMHDQILPHLPHPLLLSDFLTDAYDHGGAASMLAMHGLFVLMSKHGLEYPQFYQRLYALMTPSIFHLAHRDQFFRLTDLFLTSKGLPVYIAAAFIKRMAQLALTAPPAGCLLLLPCIYNLLQRHPTCKCMIHRERKRALDGSDPTASTTPGCAQAKADPFVADEDDPARANALESSLWELEALKRHYFPPVAKFVKVFSADFTKPVGDHL